MPELPEVEDVRRRLRPALKGQRIVRVQLNRAGLRSPFQPDFSRRLVGQTVDELRRRAKYLIADLSSGDALVMHLGMSGSFRVHRAGRNGQRGHRYHERQDVAAHDHVVFELASGATVVFNDPRRFGSMQVVDADNRGAAPFAGLGPEPLSASFDANVLAHALRGRRTAIKAALLDQQVVAGLGNIYAAEALHRARVSPRRQASRLVTRSGAPHPDAVALVDGIKAALRDAIARRHRYQQTDRFRVYDREGQPCPRRGCRGVVRRITQGGRSTFFCPVCQRR